MLLFPQGVFAAKASPTGSITLDPNQSYTYGQIVNMTGIFSSIPQSRQPQYPDQPQMQLNCSDSVGGFQQVQTTVNKKSVGNSIFQAIYMFSLSGGTTVSGPLNCALNYGYFNQIDGIPTYHQLDFELFTVN